MDPGADRNSRNDGDLVRSPSPATRDGSFPPAEPRFGPRWELAGSPIHRERRDGHPTLRRLFSTRPLLLFPPFDLVLIALQRSPLGLLWRPSHAMHQAPDMVRVVVHTKLALNHLGDARRGPQIGAVALRHRSLEQPTVQTLSLSDSQLQGAAWRRTHL